MTFDRRDIRRSLDVFTFDGGYLGVVLALDVPETAAPLDSRRIDLSRTSIVSGELLGPAPTAPRGNTGPRRQSAVASYATTRDSDSLLTSGSLRVGRWPGLWGTRSIPLDAIQTVS